MHELSITESIVRIVMQEADKNGAERVLLIKLVVGELSDFLPECIQFYFDFASQGTKAEGAKLQIRKVKVKHKCKTCGQETVSISELCQNCKGKDFEIIEGREFYIESIEVE